MNKVVFMNYDVDLFDYVNHSDRKFVLFGAGMLANKLYPYLPKVDYVCDNSADKEPKSVQRIRAITLQELIEKNEKYIVLICVKKYAMRDEIKTEIEHADIDAEVFDVNECSSLPIFQPIVKKEIPRELKRVHLINYDKEGWIISKFARKLEENLVKMGIDADVGDCVDPMADINHHIQFGYEPIACFHDTIMISHVDSRNLFERLKYQLEKAEMGICMSRDTMEKLVEWGIPRHKLCYINPGHDMIFKPKKYVLGTTHRCYDNQDFRKRDSALIDICMEIDPNFFMFKIMGAGWENIVQDMRNMGFEVEYHAEFNVDTYRELIPSLDYYLYQGFDEGSMGILDALSAGVKTIVTPQGFHLDIKDGITHECRTVKDIVCVLHELENDRKKRIEAVADWTWENYTKKHVEVWNYILGNTNSVFDNMHLYEDGIFSVLRLDS